MRMFKLSPMLVFCTLAVAALAFTLGESALVGGLYASGVVATAALLTQPLPEGVVLPRYSAMRGEAGGEPPELKSEVMKALNEHTQKLTDAIAESDKQIKEQGKVSDSVKAEISELSEKFSEFDNRLIAAEQKAVRDSEGPGRQKTAGELFVGSDNFKQFVEGGITKGRSLSVECKDITSAGTSAGPAIWEYTDPELVKDPQQVLTLRDLLTTIPIASDLARYARLKTRTNNVAPVSETGTYPESDLVWERKEAAVRKVGHTFKVSLEALEDFPQLQAEINSEGSTMLGIKEEEQLLLGDGTGINLHGILPQATAYTGTGAQSSDQMVDVLRRAILQVRLSHYAASGIMLNPQDWAAIELLKDTEQRYLFSAVTTGAQKRLWGMPVVESDSMTQGEFLVGNFRLGAAIYDRKRPFIQISTENDKDFEQDLATVKLGERLALAVKRPLAFVHGNLNGSV